MLKLERIVDQDDLYTIFRMCLMSKVVQSNKRYRECGDNTEFVYDRRNNEINACAGRNGDLYRIRIFRGILMWESVFGFIWMLALNGQKFGDTLKMFTWCARYLRNSYEGNLPDDIVEQMLAGCGVKGAEKIAQTITTARCEQWRSCTLEIVRSVIAHELGHVCLGHVDDSGYDGTIMSTNRNIERQADLFACSVLQTGTNVTMGAVATILTEISLLCFDNGGGQYTHPASKERIEYMIKSFEGLFPFDSFSVKQLVAIAEAIIKIEGKKK